MLAGTPSGITLAPEGGAHQSINTPLVGMSTPNLVSYEPAYVSELAVLMEWGFQYMQRHNGGSVYLRLSTRALEQPARSMQDGSSENIISGAYWKIAPAKNTRHVIAYTGAIAPEAAQAAAQTGAALLAITSADRLHQQWTEMGVRSHIHRLLSEAPNQTKIVSVLDGHPATLSWLGGVNGQATRPLGVQSYGQSADIPDLYRIHRIDAAAIEQAVTGD